MKNETISNYLLEGIGIHDVPKNCKFAFEPGECKIMGFRKLFDEGLHCEHYESVVSGQGKEEDKIDTIYSSSLQSFLIFDKVDEKGITIAFKNGETITFKKAIFEYKNKVIGYPSCIDVVLISEDEKSVCFVESKLFEIIRDSYKKGEGPTTDETASQEEIETNVIGISYFRKDEKSGYQKVFHFDAEDFKDLGITKEESEEWYPKHVKGKGFKSRSIQPIEENEYVYAYGVKQILSHLIGINNFKHGRFYEGEDRLSKYSSYKRYYLELYNNLPGLNQIEECENAKTKLDEFRKHVEAVFRKIKDKGIVDHAEIMTYQDLFKDGQNDGLIDPRIKKFYHL